MEKYSKTYSQHNEVVIGKETTCVTLRANRSTKNNQILCEVF